VRARCQVYFAGDVKIKNENRILPMVVVLQSVFFGKTECMLSVHILWNLKYVYTNSRNTPARFAK